MVLGILDSLQNQSSLGYTSQDLGDKLTGVTCAAVSYWIDQTNETARFIMGYESGVDLHMKVMEASSRWERRRQTHMERIFSRWLFWFRSPYRFIAFCSPLGSEGLTPNRSSQRDLKQEPDVVVSEGPALLFNFLCGLGQVIETVSATLSSFPLENGNNHNYLAEIPKITSLKTWTQLNVLIVVSMRKRRNTRTLMMIKITMTGTEKMRTMFMRIGQWEGGCRGPSFWILKAFSAITLCFNYWCQWLSCPTWLSTCRVMGPFFLDAHSVLTDKQMGCSY